MNDYIRRKDALIALSELLKDIKANPIGDGASLYADGIWQGEKSSAIEAVLRIKAIPADARSVVRGRWQKDEEDLKWGSSLVKRFCSNCKGRAYFDKEKYEFVLTDFCPNCGADMRGAEGEGK